MSIKVYCANVVVSLRPIYLKKHKFLYTIMRKTITFIAKKMVIESDIQKNWYCIKSIFRRRTVLKSMIKSLKYIW